MLDDLSLAEKIRVARDWFRRARHGDFPLLNDRTGNVFATLLEECEVAALTVSAERDIAIGQLALLESQHPEFAAVVETISNVVPLRRRQ